MRAGPGPSMGASRARRTAPRAVETDPFTGSRALAIVVGLLIAGALTLVDIHFTPHSIIIGAVVVAPFVVSVLAGWEETAAVAAVAVALTIASAAWNGNLDSTSYWLRILVAITGGTIAAIATGARERTVRDRARFALLSAIADVADGRFSLEETAAHVGELLVPGFADGCTLDVVHEGGMRRLVARASGPDAAACEEHLRRVPPGAGAPAGTAGTIAVALSARGRMLGELRLTRSARSHRRFEAEDERFARVLAGRVALALDNAGLFTELQTMEAQLTTALGTLAEAVTVQNPQGDLIYANQAAADLLGYASPQELLATPPAEIAGRYASFHEDGSPLQITDLPGRRVREGEEPEPLVLRIVDRRTGRQRWRRTKSTGVRDSTGRLRMVVNVIADITAVKRAELVQRLLAGAGDALAASEDLGETLQRIADICVPELADWCTVSMPTEHRRLQVVAVAHADAEKVALARRLGERHPVDLDRPGGVAQAFREGRPQVINEITDAMLVGLARDEEHLAVLRALGIRAGLAVPMRTGRETVGVLSLVSSGSGRTFGDGDVALATELARRAATAVENARLYTERTRIAHTLQEGLLPEALPPLPGYRTASLYRPAGDEERVGGDFYEAFGLRPGATMLIVGDVTGRGTAAAALTGLMRHTLRAIATFTGSPVRALHRLNAELISRPQASLCTAVCVVLRDRAAGPEAEIICAGHPLPILVRDGTATYVGTFGPMLGAFADVQWRPTALALRAKDILVLYSDGVLDATGPEDRFGPERLQAALAHAESATDAVRRLEAALAAFQVGPQADDTAILAIERGAVSNATRPEPRAGGTPA